MRKSLAIALIGAASLAAISAFKSDTTVSSQTLTTGDTLQYPEETHFKKYTAAHLWRR